MLWSTPPRRIMYHIGFPVSGNFYVIGRWSDLVIPTAFISVCITATYKLPV